MSLFIWIPMVAAVGRIGLFLVLIWVALKMEHVLTLRALNIGAL
jgi:hypothetical protein